MRTMLLPLLPLLHLSCNNEPASTPRSPIDLSTGTHVVLLGTGTPNADPDRSGPAVAIVVEGAVYLVDAGPGVVRRASAARLDVKRLNRVFLTHLHSDHTTGLPDLWLSPWVLDRPTPLAVYGPPGTGELVHHLAQAYRSDIERRLSGFQPSDTTGWRILATEVGPGEVYRDDRVTVTALPVDHQDWPVAYGYRFQTADRVIVVSGDTRPTETIVEACNECDVLVHEVYSDAAFARRSPEWQRYHGGAHTGAADLGRLAARANPGVLVLYHQLLWGTSDSALVAEIAAYWNGRIVSGRDLQVF